MCPVWHTPWLNSTNPINKLDPINCDSRTYPRHEGKPPPSAAAPFFQFSRMSLSVPVINEQIGVFVRNGLELGLMSPPGEPSPVYTAPEWWSRKRQSAALLRSSSPFFSLSPSLWFSLSRSGSCSLSLSIVPFRSPSPSLSCARSRSLSLSVSLCLAVSPSPSLCLSVSLSLMELRWDSVDLDLWDHTRSHKFTFCFSVQIALPSIPWRDYSKHFKMLRPIGVHLVLDWLKLPPQALPFKNKKRMAELSKVQQNSFHPK